MNKYQESLKWVKSLHSSIGGDKYYESLGMIYGQGVYESIKTLGELVDKETPMKPYINDRYCGRCDLVRLLPQENYCSNCGQKIDWSKENE